MEIKLNTKSLIEEIGYALSVVEPKSTLPILSHFLINATEAGCEIAASDLEVTFRGKIANSEVIKEGAITVGAKSFSQIIRGFSQSNELNLRVTEDRKLLVKPLSDNAEYFLNTLPAEDFPRLIEPSEKGFLIPMEVYKEMVKEVLVSVGGEDTRFSVSGVLFIIEPKTLTMVSTDSHRLSYSTRKFELDTESQQRFLVPKKVLHETLKFSQSDTIYVSVKDSQIFFKSGEILIYSRLKDTKFPAYERVIPTDVPINAVVNRVKMLEKLKRILNVSDLKTKAIYFYFKNDGSVKLETKNDQGDKGEESFVCDSFAGEDVKLALNGDYLIDFLTSITDDKVQIKMKNSESQCLFEPLREESKGICKNVSMPLRTE